MLGYELILIDRIMERLRKKLQFVNWFPEWRGFYCFKWHKEISDMAYIYDWFFCVAFWEIRKWHKLTAEERKYLEYHRRR